MHLAKPLLGKERIVSIDIIRGIALFGILLVNTPHFVIPTDLIEYQIFDEYVRLFYDLFVQRKFYLIFSFLFGLGFYIFMSRAEKYKDKHPYFLFIRRLCVLFLFGLLHKMIWYGDILRDYAKIGVLLLLFYNRKAQTILWWTCTLALLHIGALIFTIISALYEFKFENILLLERNFPVLIMFLLGLYVGKIQLFRHTVIYAHQLKTIQKTSVLISLPFLFMIVFTFFAQEKVKYAAYIYSLCTDASAIPLSIFYLSTTVLVLQNKFIFRACKPMQSVGQMALTNYLMQTLMLMALVHLFGVDLNHSLIKDFFIALIVFGIQMIYSFYWLKYFRFGPLEWVWRILTYGHLKPKAFAEKDNSLN